MCNPYPRPQEVIGEPAARSYRSWGPLGTLWDLWGPSFEEVIDFTYFYTKYVIFNTKCTFKFLEGHFLPGFLAEGRRDTQRVFVLMPETQKMFPTLILKKTFQI